MKKLLLALVLVAVMVFGPICLSYAAPLPGSWSPVGNLSVSAANVNSLATVKGTLYAGTNGGGVWAWDGSAWSRVGSLSGDAAVVFSLTTVTGRLYAGTYGGVWAWDGSVWSRVGSVSGGAAVVFSIIAVKGTLYAGTYSGVWAWDGSAWSQVGSLPGDAAYVRSLTTVEDTLYAGTYSGVWAWDGSAWSQVGSLPGDAAVVFSITAVKGTLYAGTYSGVWAWDGSAWSQVGSLPGDAAYVRGLTTVEGTLYAGTNGGGVWAWDGSAWSQVGSLSGFAAYVYGFVTVNDTLYVGTYGGVWSLPMPPRLATVTATGDISVLTVGGNGFNLNQLTMSGKDQYGNPYDLSGMSVTWLVYSGNQFATVSPVTSVLTPVAAGSGTVVATVGGVSTNPVNFSVNLKDIAGIWAQVAVERLVSFGAVAGYPDGTFRPDGNVTRGEFVTVLVKALKLAPKAGPVFADTKGNWAQGYISTAAAYGIVNGFDDSHFGPSDLITREQMAAIVVRVDKLALVSGPLPFKDAAFIDPWARVYVETAVKDGIVHGYPDGTFNPLGLATRAEAVTVIAGILK